MGLELMTSEIKGRMLYPLSQPGAPKIYFNSCIIALYGYAMIY